MNGSRGMSLIAILIIATVTSASGQTIFVTTSADMVDFGGTQQVADLPGPDGLVSLAEAGLASDNTPGVQTIGFQVPQADWQYQQFFPGRVVLRPFLGFRVFDTAIIDGRTQTAFTGETNPDGGAEVVIWAETYVINSVGGAVYGLDSSSIHLSGGSDNVVQGNTNVGIEIFDSSSNMIGGPNAGEGNTGGVIQIDRASNNIVVGNTVQRVRVLGWIGGGQPAANNRIGGPNPEDRNYITGYGIWNSEGIPGGFAVQLFDSVGTIIENNLIGTTPDGMQQGDIRTTSGIYFDSENHDTMIKNNRIAGILALAVPPHGPSYRIGYAIQIGGTGSGITVVGNKIGLNANDEPLLGSTYAIYPVGNNFYTPVGSIVIGGSGPGEGNEIAGHLSAAIVVDPRYSGMRISGNSIHDNGGIGIDLVTNLFGYGVTPNDAGDSDTGGNGLQNFPVLSEASSQGATTLVAGNLNSTPNTTFDLEFFANDACDPSGNGEGQIVLGGGEVTTDASGNAAFQFTLPAASAVGQFMTATATDRLATSTSEFSACLAIVEGQVVAGDIDGDGDLDMDDQVMLIDVLLGNDPGSVRADRCDLNIDGLVNANDVAPFIALMLGW